MSQDTTASAAAAPVGLIFRRELRIERGDCDPAQIAFYPRYLAFFDANTAAAANSIASHRTIQPMRPGRLEICCPAVALGPPRL